MKRAALLVLALTALVLFVACGGAPAVPQLPSVLDNGRESVGGLPAPAATSAPAQPPSVINGGKDSSGLQAQLDQAASERMVVYTGTLSLEVQDTEETVSKIGDILKANQGYVANRSLDRDNKGKVKGTITIRVPASSLDSVLSQIRALGIKVLHEDAKSDDVTAEYTDLDARRKNLEAYEVQLTQLLDTVRERTGKAEDILAVYNQLTEVRGQIEQIKGRQNYLQNTSSFATYTVQLVPHEEVTVLDEGWNPGSTARTALRSLVEALQGLADVGIVFLLFIVPILVVFAIPLVIVIWFLRRVLRNRMPRRLPAA